MQRLKVKNIKHCVESLKKCTNTLLISFFYVLAVKRKQELFASEAKRSRSQSPVPADFKLPPFNPQNPLGKKHTQNIKI